MEKKKMALCTPIPESKLGVIREFCDITICGELKHGKGNAPEAQHHDAVGGGEVVGVGDLLEKGFEAILHAADDEFFSSPREVAKLPLVVDAFRMVEEADNLVGKGVKVLGNRFEHPQLLTKKKRGAPR